MSTAADRVLSLLLLGLAAFVAVQANQLEVPFSYDPVGPKAFPMLMAAVLAVLALALLVRPGKGKPWPRGILLVKLVSVLVVLGAYAWAFSALGYLLATAVTSGILAYLFNAGALRAVLAGVLLSIGSYLLFTYALGITLPWGHVLPALG
ncbi:tripartite tricarboxylate transporter TctB family protein [Pokkaliibacter sp. MBI-7]|uniref:tripartite tricarboxylate transporter TctB family protein n=1 Tax=Pokkaliibacter sp. MBI-7 TaxID=3040600 RepID=UPI00244BD3FA|nr:tripartite tricarboxylate transporter TctB family protein [Pokkaliibacter sp. MBI-7]MDH2436334.1 tripartite tricarboxylate transporter TctB family protein [Pokkaliibacter sp. MBI-7]